MAQLDKVRVEMSSLPVGVRLAHPIFDEEDRLLLAAGIELTENLKQLLTTRNLQWVLLHKDDAKLVSGPPARSDSPPGVEQRNPESLRQVRRSNTIPRRSSESRLKSQAAPSDAEVIETSTRQLAILAAKVSTTIDTLGPPLVERVKRHGCVPYQQQQRQRLAKSFATGKQLIDAMIRHATAGLSQDVHVLRSVAAQIIDELQEDSDHAVAATGELLAKPAIAERGVRTAVLGMATAVELGWDEQHVQQVGICGLVYGWGINRLPADMQRCEKPLSDDERREFRQYPLHTFRMLQSARQLSDEVRVAVTQIHENPDGSGYPNGLKETEIHPYARVLHVVDSYLTLTTEMWGRKPYLSYDAMVYLLNQVKAHRIDGEAMRALLNALALFPIGSHVKLSDDSIAQVIRRGDKAFTKPIVQRIDGPHKPLLDLADSELKIVAPVAGTGNELSIEEKLMGQILWE